ncbi:MmoB/DmpM family protein [Alicyclobacillus fastidiosus]|uniref:MmoB/DmpM family protein n=1 Tax=Alicyclobacillus fastidiosus TaxID=392011 RepID=A0ABV5AJB2_9BACL|nr:MmoB/DmpM family protein [Alicyclobacillus fastidiosus]WEH08378.1 MmoB/DmpM family protein [Alicyclobacillus fastidiosus]
MSAYVGMDLDKNSDDVVEAIVNALKAQGDAVVADDMGVFVKVKVPGRLILRREDVEKTLGREWSMDELHVCMASYFGYIKEWDEEHIEISWG